MNLYLQSIGFSDISAGQEEKLIKNSIKEFNEAGLIIKQEDYKRGVLVIRVSESTGIYVYGRLKGKRFIYEYYYPFVIGSHITENDELVIDRHADKESFAVISEERNTGISLIFYLQNVYDYLNYTASNEDKKYFSLDKRNVISRNPIYDKKTVLAGLSLGGMILLPVYDGCNHEKKKKAELYHQKLIREAKDGNEKAIEQLTVKDLDTYASISLRVKREDVFSIVDSTFMPCGIECDQYSVVGKILELSEEQNVFTKDKIYIMKLECNGIIFTMAINSCDLLGEPLVGRRFKGQVWLQGIVRFND